MRCASLAILIFLPVLAAGADFRSFDVSRADDTYQIQALVYLAAPPQAVFAVLTDYDHFTRISGSIVQSHRVRQLDANDALVYTDTRFCALFFCRHVKEMQKVTQTPPGDIVSTVLPEQSDNVKSGSASLHMQAEGEGTLLHWRIRLQPGFWVPPLLGPYLVERSLRTEGHRSADGVEKLARERAHLAPLDGAEQHGKEPSKDPTHGAP
ncbi:MAG TPA: SRPBCC family protein [Gammaproteobacteria bacterium]|nr:SRPBCC family protein [Gammaproteobacteria bacterium]